MKQPDLIKICGLSTPQAIDAVVENGGTHLGFIFFEKSPRHISLETARALSAHAADRSKKVAVSVNADDETLDAIVDALRPDLLQLHGSETPDRVLAVKKRHGLPVIKALAVSTREDLEKAKTYIGIADHFLFDAKAPANSALPGGNGVAFDWQVMDAWPDSVPYILSGGLNAENVETAVISLQPAGLDISSGVESAPGIKDIAMIETFMQKLEKGPES